MTPATVQKRAQLRAFIAQVPAPHPAVQAVVGIGSLANGRMRPDSDIDAIIPIGEAFVRGADEPGRAWNMAAWNARRER